MSCPSLPDWRTLDAGERAISLPANQSIEAAYERAHQGNIVLYGRHFDDSGPKTEVNLAKGVNAPFGRELLKELRGLQNQRRPDIVDFTERTFYEIKPVVTANRQRARTIDQLTSLYRLAERIREKYGVADEPEWTQHNATWVPPTTIRMISDPINSLVCTAATDYADWGNGIILYDIRRRVRRRRQNEQSTPAVEVIGVETGFRAVMPDGNSLRALVPTYAPDEPNYVIIAPEDFYERVQVEIQMQRNRQYLEFVQIDPPFLDRKHPVGQLRRLVWPIIGATAGAFAVAAIAGYVVIGIKVSAAGAAAAGTGAAGGAAGGGAASASVTSLSVYRAAKVAKLAAAATAASKAKVASAAAAAIVVAMLLPSSDAHAATSPKAKSRKGKILPPPKVSAVLLVNVAEFKPVGGQQVGSTAGDVRPEFRHTSETAAGQFGLGTAVKFNNEDYRIIGQVVVKTL